MRSRERDSEFRSGREDLEDGTGMTGQGPRYGSHPPPGWADERVRYPRAMGPPGKEPHQFPESLGGTLHQLLLRSGTRAGAALVLASPMRIWGQTNWPPTVIPRNKPPGAKLGWCVCVVLVPSDGPPPTGRKVGEAGPEDARAAGGHELDQP